MKVALIRATCVVVLSGLFSGCATLFVDQEARSRIAELEAELAEHQNRLNELDSRTNAMGDAYGEAVEFINELQEAGRFPSANATINAILGAAATVEETVAMIDSGIARYQASVDAATEQLEKKITDLGNETTDDLTRIGDENEQKIEILALGYESRIEEANAELSRIILDAESKLDLSMRGMESKFDEYKSVTNTKLDTFFGGFEQEFSDFTSATQAQLKTREATVDAVIRGLVTKEERDLETLRSSINLMILGLDSSVKEIRAQVAELSGYIDVVQAIKSGIESTADSIK
jgi:hypothetical protein